MASPPGSRRHHCYFWARWRARPPHVFPPEIGSYFMRFRMYEGECKGSQLNRASMQALATNVIPFPLERRRLMEELTRDPVSEQLAVSAASIVRLEAAVRAQGHRAHRDPMADDDGASTNVVRFPVEWIERRRRVEDVLTRDQIAEQLAASAASIARLEAAVDAQKSRAQEHGRRVPIEPLPRGRDAVSGASTIPAVPDTRRHRFARPARNGGPKRTHRKDSP